MTDYITKARQNKITFTQAYVKTHNAMVELTSIPKPTNDDFKKSELLSKQLKIISKEITEECIKKEGYTLNNHTQMWEKLN